MYTNEEIRNMVNDLKLEAKNQLNDLFEYHSKNAESIDKFVECIINAAVLQTALIQKESVEQNVKSHS